MRDYKTHFELWNDASDQDGDIVVAAKQRGTLPVARRARFGPYRILAIAMVAIPIAALAILLWMASRSAPPRATSQLSPQPIPSVAISGNQEAAASRPAIVTPPPAPQIEPLAKPSAPVQPQSALAVSSAAAVIASTPAVSAPPAKLATAKVEAARPIENTAHVEPRAEATPQARSEDNAAQTNQPAVVDSRQLESSIRSDLAHEGLPDLGVSVDSVGDVFITGIVLRHEDKDRAIAIARAHSAARDIYFSGGVWHSSSEPTEQSSAAAAPQNPPSPEQPARTTDTARLAN